MRRILLSGLLLGVAVLSMSCAGHAIAAPATRPAAVAEPPAAEIARTIFFPEGVRAVIHQPADFSEKKPTKLIIFALPNGNTIEQTIGCQPSPGLDWHFNIQHIAAQVRQYRQIDRSANVVVAYIEADTFAWPAWRGKRPEAPQKIAGFIDDIRKAIPGGAAKVTLACHSGGGAFIFSFIDGQTGIPNWIDGIILLDANYSYDTEKGHGRKLVDWLKGGSDRRLAVIAYDDRNITLNGKKVVSDTGGTWRASHRMLDAMAEPLKLAKTETPSLVRHEALGGRLRFVLHTNPETKILHTRLVEMNGMLEGLAAGTAMDGKWGGSFYGTRAYDAHIQSLPSVPQRRPDLPGGKALGERWAKLTPEQRETAIAAELLRGNLPDRLWKWEPIKLTATIDGKPRTAIVRVSPDWLAVGSDDDFLRVPMTPMTAAKVSAALGGTLPTKKLVDAIDAAATVRIAPHPMTEARESLATFIEHNTLIEQARMQRAGLLTGGKKDIVWTNRLLEKPGKVAIYGWRKADGQPIQPLTTVHKATYVDYSHGVRLISRVVEVDGKPMLLETLLADPKLHTLVSDEGPIDLAKLLPAS